MIAGNVTYVIWGQSYRYPFDQVTFKIFLDIVTVIHFTFTIIIVIVTNLTIFILPSYFYTINENRYRYPFDQVTFTILMAIVTVILLTMLLLILMAI